MNPQLPNHSDALPIPGIDAVFQEISTWRGRAFGRIHAAAILQSHDFTENIDPNLPVAFIRKILPLVYRSSLQELARLVYTLISFGFFGKPHTVGRSEIGIDMLRLCDLYTGNLQTATFELRVAILDRLRQESDESVQQNMSDYNDLFVVVTNMDLSRRMTFTSTPLVRRAPIIKRDSAEEMKKILEWAKGEGVMVMREGVVADEAKKRRREFEC